MIPQFRQCYSALSFPAPNNNQHRNFNQPNYLDTRQNDEPTIIQTNPNHPRRCGKHPTLQTPPRPLRRPSRLPPILSPLNTRPPQKWQHSTRCSGPRRRPPRRRPPLQLRPRQRLHNSRHNRNGSLHNGDICPPRRNTARHNQTRSRRDGPP